MAKLVCVSRYVSAARVVEPGQTLEVSEVEAAFLRADAPGCWAGEEASEVEGPATDVGAEEAEGADADEKAPDKPPKDRMVRNPPKQK